MVEVVPNAQCEESGDREIRKQTKTGGAKKQSGKLRFNPSRNLRIHMGGRILPRIRHFWNHDTGAICQQEQLVGE